MSAPWLEVDTALPSLGVATLVGVGFGAALERAGLGSARKLTAQFYGADLTVLKVMLSAIVVAMLGVFWLSRAGLVDLARVAVPETFWLPQLVGGVVFGGGMATAGLCPGTSCVSVASGRADGASVIAGMFAGITVTGLLCTPLHELYEATPGGSLTVPAWLDVPYGAVVLAVVSLALVAFYVAERIEARS